MLDTADPPYKRGREYDRYLTVRLDKRGYDGEGFEKYVSVHIIDDGVLHVELRQDDVWVLRSDRDDVTRWKRPSDTALCGAEVPAWGREIVTDLDLEAELL